MSPQVDHRVLERYYRLPGSVILRYYNITKNYRLNFILVFKI